MYFEMNECGADYILNLDDGYRVLGISPNYFQTQNDLKWV